MPKSDLADTVRDDIADLMAENSLLREELARLRGALDRLPVGLYQATPDGTPLYANAAAQDILDRVGDETAARLTTAIREAEDEDGCQSDDAAEDGNGRTAGAGTLASREAVWQSHDGRTHHIDESLRVIRPADGGPAYYEAALEDITDRRRTEAALRASEELYRLLVEHSPAGILLLNDESRMVYVSPELCRIMGRDRSEAIGTRFTDWLHPDGVTDVVSRYERRQAGETVPDRYDTVAIHADGTPRLISINATAFQTSDGSMRTVAQVLDITDRNKAEQALRDYTEALEVRNAELDAFADSVAHDLKNPLSTIIGFAEALLEALDEFTPDEIERVLTSISSMGRKMDSIIEEMLLFARIRQKAVDPTPINMRVIVENALDRLESTRAKYDGRIVMPSHWPMALGYGPWVEEVWANYISNALKYGGTPPVITLGSSLNEDGQVRFWVRDNGNGVEPERQATLFDGNKAELLASAKGYGLGLSIVKRIVTKLGGAVAVESTGHPGEGSVFSFTLPAATLAAT